MRKQVEIICAIIGTLIGAGFASGQEIFQFFYAHGMQKGMVGIIISNVMIGIILFQIIELIKKYKIIDYDTFLKEIFNENKLILTGYEIITNLILLITFFIMISAFGECFKEELKFSKIIGCITLIILFCLVTRKDISRFLNVNRVIVPIMILVIIVVGILNLFESRQLENFINYEKRGNNFIVDAVLYSSYNIVLLIPTIILLSRNIEKRAEMFSISLYITLISMILTFSIYFILKNIDMDLNNIEIPVLYLINQKYKIIKPIYVIVLLSSIFTTTVAMGRNFLDNMRCDEKDYKKSALKMGIIALCFSGIKFSKLINAIYPIIGYLGMYEIIKVIIKNRRSIP